MQRVILPVLLLSLPVAMVSACEPDAPVIDTWAPVTTPRPDDGKNISAMTIDQETRFTAVVGGNGSMGLIADDTHMCFEGQFGGPGNLMNGTTKIYNFLKGSAHFLVTGEATIDNNSDMVNARPFEFIGEDGSQEVEFASDFHADQTGFVEGVPPELQTAWTHQGLSTLRIHDATFISHATCNLPSIHKQASSGNHTHHGLLVFAQATWRVRSAAQEYEGGLNYTGDWTLDAGQDVRIFGSYSDDAKILVGNFGATGYTITKTGAADFIIDIPQGYSTDSALVIDQGLVDMHTDPGDPGQAFYDVGVDWPPQNPGQYLAVTLAAAGSLRLRADSGLLSLANAGAVQIDSGLDVTDGMTCDAGAVCTLAIDAAPVTVGGTLSVDGSLIVTGTPGADRVNLIEAGQGLTGTFASADLPTGYALVYETDAVVLERTVRRSLDFTVIDDAEAAMTTAVIATQGGATVYDAEAENHRIEDLDPAENVRVQATEVPTGNL